MATNGTAATGDTQDYDSLPRLIPHLDRHLVFPIVQFLEGSAETDEEALALKKSRFELLKGTGMVDYVAHLKQEIDGTDTYPEEFVPKREEVMSKKSALEQKAAKIIGLMEDSEVTSNFRSDKVANLKYLQDEHGVQPEEIAALYDLGQFLYNVGSYDEASDILFSFRLLVRSQQPPLLG